MSPAVPRGAMREAVRVMFYHSMRSYMTHGFPEDELAPLSCKGKDQEQTAGNMMTLIDALDTFAVMQDWRNFVAAVLMLQARLHFDHDQNVSVYVEESRGRGVGGVGGVRGVGGVGGVRGVGGVGGIRAEAGGG